MSNYKRINVVVCSSALAVVLFAAFVFSAAQAFDVAVGSGPADQFGQSFNYPETAAAHIVDRQTAEPMGQGTLVLPTTTLSISNLSTIWALVDKQNPSTGPRVFVVEAEVVNTGSEPAVMPNLVLEYNEDPANGWVLLPGEDPIRTISNLNPGESYYAYWFASYPAVENQEHEYTISAYADNAELVSTNKSVFDTPALTQTVKTLDFQRTGNTGQGLTDVEALVGVAYTITVNYDLGQQADELIFSPVGNADFDPSATRLLSTTVSFQNSDGSQQTDIDNQLYFPSLPALPNGSDPTRAVTTYKMVALKPAETRLCAYTGVRTNTDKYDKDYCNDENVIIIIGSSSLELAKSANSATVLQDGSITYTLVYTNSGNVAVPFAWIWDEVDPTVGTITARTNDPAPDPAVSDENLVAWHLTEIPAAGQPGSSGILTLTMEINGGGQVMTDGMPIVNDAHFGISPSGLPSVAAITSTITSTLQAPSVTIDKSDGLTSIIAGDWLTYTVTLQNNGSALATGLVITDRLPLGVVLAGTPTPIPDSVAGRELEWNSSTLGDLQPNGGMMTLTLPISVDPGAGNGTILTNSAVVKYQNSAGFIYPEQVGEDMTTVRTSADLSIVKFGKPDPVAPGGIVTYTLVLTNSGPSDAANVFITDTLDSAVEFGGVVTANVPLTGPFVAGQVVAWEMSTLDAGEVGTLVYTATVHPATEGSITNEVQISAETLDPDQNNNQSESTLTVGDPDAGTIYGYVFTDSNGNGLQDPGETGIEGVSVSLDGAYTTTTDIDGLFTFLTGIGGVHNVVESQPSGYFSTTPDEVHVAVILGNVYQVNFGEAPEGIGFASIFGTVFEDADSSQSWDFEEVGLKDVTVTLDMASAVQTDLYGQFTFSTTISGEHTVVESDPEFYFSTTPNTVTVDLALNMSEEVNFGDVRVEEATCDADEYEEDDQYTVAKELLIGQEQEHDFCDDAVDWLKVTVTAGQNYTFTTASWGQRADTYLALFDEDGQSLLVANDDMEGTTDYSSQIKWLASRSGEVYIRVTNRAALEGLHSDYRIWAEEEKLNFLFLPFVKVEPVAQPAHGQSVLFRMFETDAELIIPMVPKDPLGAIVHSCPDSYESDDTWQMAKPIVDGVSQWHSFDSDPAIYAADKDFFSFEILSGQEITFTVTSNLGVGVLLEVYDKSGKMLGIAGTDSLHVSGIQSGAYFLSASPISPAYSCVEDEGYEVLADKEEIYIQFIPAMVK